MKKLIIIPVYNEVKNIKQLFLRIRKSFKSDLLYINDNSTDGTTEEINSLVSKFKNVYHIKRNGKLGVGSAHKVGIKWGYKKKYDLIITMDGDGTHDPKYLNKITHNSDKYDLVLTNRFLVKNSLKSWPFLRVILTHTSHLLLKTLLGLKHDTSGAFRLLNTNKVKLKDLLLANDNDYAYFWKSIFYLKKKKYNIGEIPIILPARVTGKSKMNLWHIIRGVLSLFMFFLLNIFKKNHYI
jgi:dolichol-phosphate mannosyltransferase